MPSSTSGILAAEQGALPSAQNGRAEGRSAAADAQRAPPGLVGLLLIAPGVDASELRWAALTAEQHAAVQAGGAAPLDSPYIAGGGGGLSKAFFEQGRRQRLLTGTALHVPLSLAVRVLAGARDVVVPLAHVERFVGAVNAVRGECAGAPARGAAAVLQVLAQGDHRLSDGEGLAALEAGLVELLRGAAAAGGEL